MGFFSRLTDIEGDEVSLVKRGANRRSFLLAKGDDVAELDDMVSVPVEYEGALTDVLRKAGSDETTIEALVTGLRLMKASEADLPDGIREEVEKLGSQLYPLINKPLNNMDDADNDSGGANEASEQNEPARKASQAPETGDDDEPDEDDNAGASKSDDNDEDDAGSGMSKDDDVDMAADDGDADEDDVKKTTFTESQRKKLSGTGAALPDGSFPIRNKSDLSNAIHAYGRAGNKPRAKAHIIARAKSLGATSMLPEGWGSSGGNVNKEGTMSEGTAEVAVPVPVRKEDGSWDLSGVPEESRPFFESVLDGRDAVAKERDDLRGRVEKAEEKLEEERALRLDREFIAKAEKEFSHVAPADELGPVLKEIASAIPEESYEVLTKALAAAEERIEKGGLFAEYGRAGTPEESKGDAWSQIEKEADSLVEKDAEMTQAQAITAVLATDRGKELYAQYQREV